MFSLHEATIFLLAVVAVGTGMAGLTAMRGWMGPRRTALLFVVGLMWPWPIAAYLGFDSYTLTIGLYFSLWTTVALCVGLVWGLIARRAAAGATVMIVAALIPGLAGALFVLERQRVPDATCAAEVEVHIGALRLAVPRDIGIRSVTADGAPAQAWEGIYSDWPGAKPDVRAICLASADGRTPVAVTHVWLSFSWFRQEIEAVCENALSAPRLGAVCAAAARTTPTVVQFYARPDGRPAPSLSHFNPTLITQALSADEREGYRCSDSTIGPGTRYCTMWYQLVPEILVVASAKIGMQQDGEDPLADTILLIDALIRQLDPE